jgi:hypothetical protein
MMAGVNIRSVGDVLPLTGSVDNAVPRVIVTDKLTRDSAAKREILPSVEHRQQRSLNNREENSHQPTRQCECRMQRFKPAGQANAFSPPMVPSRRTSAHDATGSRLPHTVKRCGNASNRGRRSPVQPSPHKR